MEVQTYTTSPRLPAFVNPSCHPTFIAQSPCWYKHVSDVEQPKNAESRNSAPANIIWNQIKYETLQPGIMLGSGGDHNELLTTSGIIVQDVYGYHYLTLASHGFPPGREIVYHPNPNGVYVGRVHDELTDTGIAL